MATFSSISCGGPWQRGAGQIAYLEEPAARLWRGGRAGGGPSVSYTRRPPRQLRVASLSVRAPSQYRYVANVKLDIRTALKHPMEQGKVAGPPGPSGGARSS